MTGYNSLFGSPGNGTADAALRHWWKLQDAAASTVVVDSAGVTDGTLAGGVNTADISVAGPGAGFAAALSFDGVNDDVRAGDITTAEFGVGVSFTSLARIKPPVSISAMHPWISGKAEAGTAFYGLRVWSNGDLVADLRDNSSNRAEISATLSTYAVNDDAWHTVAQRLVRGGDHDIWADGSVRHSVSASHVTAAIEGTNQFFIARSSVGRYFEGPICDVALFAKALSDTELLEWEAGPEPYNTVAPVVSGYTSYADGIVSLATTLTCSTGSWDSQNNGTITYTYQWYRADDRDKTNAVAISGATSSSYTVTSSDDGKCLYCRVAAENDGGNDPVEDTDSDVTGYIVRSVTTVSIQASGGDYATPKDFLEDLDISFSAGQLVVATCAAETFSQAAQATVSAAFNPAGYILQGQGKGSTIVQATASMTSILDIEDAPSGKFQILQDFEIDGNSQDIRYGINLGAGTADNAEVRRLCIHGIDRVSGAGIGDAIRGSNATTQRADNCEIYDCSANTTGAFNGIRDFDSVRNCTVAKITNAGSGSGVGMSSVPTVYNSAVIGCDTGFAGSGATAATNNASDDSTHPGSSGVAITSADFADYAGDDFTPASGGDLVDTGADLGSAYAVDLNGYTRAGSWDIGAIEYVAAGGATPHGVFGLPIRGPLSRVIG